MKSVVDKYDYHVKAKNELIDAYNKYETARRNFENNTGSLEQYQNAFDKYLDAKIAFGKMLNLNNPVEAREYNKLIQDTIIPDIMK